MFGRGYIRSVSISVYQCQENDADVDYRLRNTLHISLRILNYMDYYQERNYNMLNGTFPVLSVSLFTLKFLSPLALP